VCLRLLFPLLAIAIVAAGCGQRAEPVGPLAQSYPVTVHGNSDEPTVLDRQPRRIVALSAGAAELVARLGAGKQIVGAPPNTRDVPANAADVVTRSGQVLSDEIERVHPDLIVAGAETDTVSLSQTVDRTGAPVYRAPGSSVPDVRRAALELGTLVGAPAAGRQLSGQIDRDVARIERRIADEPTTTVFVDTGFFVTVSPRSLLGDLVRRAGGRNVAGPNPGLEPVPIGRLLRRDPEVYLATSDSGATLARLRRERRTRRLTAVREGRVVRVPAELVASANPRVAQGLERIARALHPDAFG